MSDVTSSGQKRLLRTAIGPTPWFVPPNFSAGGTTYHFVRTSPETKSLVGLVSLQDSQNSTLLIMDFQCYLRVLPDGTALLWRKSSEKSSSLLVFDCFSLTALPVIADVEATAAQVRAKKLGHSHIPACEHWEISPLLEPGPHSINILYDWSMFEETLALADHVEVVVYGEAASAIFVFDWRARQVNVLPQDWFNEGSHHDGYIWIARVARREDNTIVGSGIRMHSFLLDVTGQLVEQFLKADPFLGAEFVA